jgi:PAS domain-containing protein
VLRNLLRFLDALPALYLVGGASAVFTSCNQRLGDMVANTVVTRRTRTFIPELIPRDDAEKFNSLLQMPHLAARLRQQVSPELAYLAYEALVRRDELSPETRVEVFRQLAGRMRELVKFPDEITAALGDERYVRNVLEVVTASSITRKRVRGAS